MGVSMVEIEENMPNIVEEDTQVLLQKTANDFNVSNGTVWEILRHQFSIPTIFNTLGTNSC